MMTAFLFRVLAAGTISLTTLVAQAGEINHHEALQLVNEGKILPVEEIIASNPTLAEGRLLDLELEREDGHLVYEFKMLINETYLYEYEVDAVTGLIRKMELED